MSAGGHLPALELDNVRASAELGKNLLTAPEKAGKGAWQHNAINDDLAELPAHENQAVSKLDFGRLLNENNCFEAGRHFTRLPQTELSERSLVPPLRLSDSLTSDNVGLNTLFAPVVPLPTRNWAGDAVAPLSASRPFSTYAEMVL